MVKFDEDMRAQYIAALNKGMSFESACAYAQIPQEIVEKLEADAEEMFIMKQTLGGLEHTLLSRMHTISKRQARQGNERVTVWLLERLFPRYAQQGVSEGGAIHLHVDSQKLENLDTVDIVRPNS